MKKTIKVKNDHGILNRTFKPQKQKTNFIIDATECVDGATASALDEHEDLVAIANAAMFIDHGGHETLLTRRQILKFERSIDPIDDTVQRTLEIATAAHRQLDEVVLARMYSLIAANKYPASKRVDGVVEAFD